MNILIFGLGVSGLGVLEFSKKIGINYEVYDEASSNAEPIDIAKFDFMVKSPGIPLSHKLVQKFLEFKIPVISDLELFKKFVKKGAKIIGITGSNGKSTTASLVYHILKTTGKNVFLGGNIGKSPLVEEALNADFVVLEVSSYQLEITDFIFDAGIILNISNNHLERHKSMEEYVKIKQKILKGASFPLSPDDFSVHNILQNGYSLIKDKFYKNGVFVSIIPEFNELKGEHNRANLLVAIVLCTYFTLLSMEEVLKATESFKSLPHRIEFVATKEGVKFFNDSKSTTATATLIAFKTFPKTPIFLIAGGRMKEEGIEAILPTSEASYVKEIILIGECAGIFAKKILEFNKIFPQKAINYFIAGTLEKAVEIAFISAKKVKHSVVLLSPLCASLDQFKNFEERGEKFKQYVNNL